MAEMLRSEDWAKCAGLWHDLGKYRCIPGLHQEGVGL